MTKLKSKKMSKSTIAIIIMAIAMVAMLTFGATFALFTASTTQIASSNVKTGKVSLTTADSSLTFTSNRVLPGDNLVSGSLTVTPASTTLAPEGEYVAVKISLSVKQGNTEVQNAVANTLRITFAPASGTFSDGTGTWVATDTDDVYVYIARPGSGDPAATSNALAMTAATAVLNDITFNAFDHMQEAELALGTSDNNLMDADISVTIDFRAVQAHNFTGNHTANDIAEYLFGANGEYNTKVSNDTANTTSSN